MSVTNLLAIGGGLLVGTLAVAVALGLTYLTFRSQWLAEPEPEKVAP